MCSLRMRASIRTGLTPILSYLVVSLKYQKQGIEKKLIKAIKNKAKELRYEKLYLFAFSPTVINYYNRLGWDIIDMDKLKKHPVTVIEFRMCKIFD